MARKRWPKRRRAVDVKSTVTPDNSVHDQDERPSKIFPGQCKTNSCPGTELACIPYSDGTFTCICTHDSYPPTLKGECPRNTVKDEVPGRIPIHMNVPPTTEGTTSASTEHASAPNFILPSIGFLVISMILVTFLVLCLRRKLKRNNGRASPINLKRSLLLAERYAPNPQYSACSATGVPLLKKETLTFLKEVGEGCFGKVYKGELLSEDGEEVKVVAIKVLKDTANKEAEEDFLREVEIMSAFRHPNILSLLGVVLKDDSINPMMVFEFMPHGDLAELLRSQRRTGQEKEVPSLTKSDLLVISLQVAKGMRYLASQRFVHRDLACRNCLVAEGPVVKIADFGMSRDVYTCDYYKIGGSRLLPVRWMSPESVVYGRFTLESDIWSYGVVLWEVYSYGKQPYYGHSNEEVVKLILDGVMLIPPQDCPTIICELMKNCWKTEPRHRITFPNICDKLELASEGLERDGGEAYYEDEKRAPKGPDSNRSLPRPPPLPVIADVDLLDGQGYLKPNEVKKHVTYLETVSD